MIFFSNSLRQPSFTYSEYTSLTGQLTCFKLAQHFNLSYKIYFIIILIILIFFLFNLKLTLNIILDLYKIKSTYKWPIPKKYQIIIDHVNFLLFPFIIEFLSFSYYMYFFPDKFIIKYDIENHKFLLILFMVINIFCFIFKYFFNNSL
jgi:hypothetical protein